MYVCGRTRNVIVTTLCIWMGGRDHVWCVSLWPFWLTPLTGRRGSPSDGVGDLDWHRRDGGQRLVPVVSFRSAASVAGRLLDRLLGVRAQLRVLAVHTHSPRDQVAE